MGEFHGLDGLEDAGIVKGPQEKATEKFINRFREGKADNAMADFLYSSMLSIGSDSPIHLSSNSVRSLVYFA